LQINKVRCTILNDGFGLDSGYICQINGGFEGKWIGWLIEGESNVIIKRKVWDFSRERKCFVFLLSSFIFYVGVIFFCKNEFLVVFFFSIGFFFSSRFNLYHWFLLKLEKLKDFIFFPWKKSPIKKLCGQILLKFFLFLTMHISFYNIF
jgi:hypothetical protein